MTTTTHRPTEATCTKRIAAMLTDGSREVRPCRLEDGHDGVCKYAVNAAEDFEEQDQQQVRDTIPARFACPDWCISGPSGHQQALDEGCTWEEARVHRSGDYVGNLDALSSPYNQQVMRDRQAGWQVVTVADPGAGQWFGHPFIEVELHEYSETTRKRVAVSLTSGEARVLAAQLLKLADGIDLQG